MGDRALPANIAYADNGKETHVGAHRSPHHDDKSASVTHVAVTDCVASARAVGKVCGTIVVACRNNDGTVLGR